MRQGAPAYEARLPVEIRPAEPGELKLHSRLLLRDGSDPDDVAARIARGDVCFFALDRGEPVHFTWLFLTSPWLAALRSTLVLGPRETYLGHAYTRPEFRGQGLQLATGLHILRWERERGYERHYYYVQRHNLSAMRLADLTRASRAMRMSRVVRSFRVAGVPGFLYRGLEEEARPELRLGAGLRVRRLGGALWVRDAPG